MIKSILLVLMLSFTFAATAQYEELRMEDYVYVTNIKSAHISPLGNTLEPAITYLGNGVVLRLSFDDMDADQKDFTYDIIHCDRNWMPSTELAKQEYIEGFVNEEVDNWRFSTGTFVPYTNYTLNIPNRDVSLLLSGNYVIVVYEGEEDEDRIPVLTRRFVVVDRQVSIQAEPRRPMDVSKIDSHQEFNLVIENKDFPIIDPMINLTVSVNQNANWNYAIENIAPRIALGEKIIVDNTGIVSFPALNEFRSLDIRSFDIVSNDIQALELTDNGTNILVKLGEPRVNNAYSTYPDANGAFVIDTRDNNNSATQSDYGNVIFSLDMPEVTEDVYVLGKFTDWQVDDMYKMYYDNNREIYLAEIELKQGFYDYMFAVDNGGFLDPTPIEGSSFEALNFYCAFVYLREPGDRYDRVIGYAKLASGLF